MKAIKYFTLATVLGAMLCSCGGNSQPAETGTKFKPVERTSSLTDSEREQKLAAMREEMNGISVDTMFYSHGVKMSVLPPAVSGDVTESAVERMTMKMLSITTQNGIGGMGSNPCFALAATMEATNRAATGTAPQKMMVEYDVTYYVINCVTGDLFGSVTNKVTGVGSSFTHATQMAVNEIKNTQELQKMLATSSDRIIDWYNTNLPLLKSKVAQAEAENDYALALALLESVPSQAPDAYKWANEQVAPTLQKMLRQKAADYFAEMKSAIAKAGVSYNPDVAAYMKMIPVDSPEYKEAQTLYNTYSQGVKDERIAEMDHQRKMELEEFAWMKEKTKLEMEASMKSMELNAGVEKAKAYSQGLGKVSTGMAVGGLLTNLLMRPMMMPFGFARFLF